MASNSRAARAACASAPIAAYMSCAVRSCSRASSRWLARRSHSPYNGATHDFGLLNALRDVPSTNAALRQAASELARHLR